MHTNVFILSYKTQSNRRNEQQARLPTRCQIARLINLSTLLPFSAAFFHQDRQLQRGVAPPRALHFSVEIRTLKLAHKLYHATKQHAVGNGKLRPDAAIWRTRRNIRVVTDSAHSLRFVKTRRHPQNRQYITYRITVREGSSHGHW